jgi:hypothetical protein
VTVMIPAVVSVLGDLGATSLTSTISRLSCDSISMDRARDFATDEVVAIAFRLPLQGPRIVAIATVRPGRCESGDVELAIEQISRPDAEHLISFVVQHQFRRE